MCVRLEIRFVGLRKSKIFPLLRKRYYTFSSSNSEIFFIGKASICFPRTTVLSRVSLLTVKISVSRCISTRLK
jgi:hypothetical protein